MMYVQSWIMEDKVRVCDLSLLLIPWVMATSSYISSSTQIPLHNIQPILAHGYSIQLMAPRVSSAASISALHWGWLWKASLSWVSWDVLTSPWYRIVRIMLGLGMDVSSLLSKDRVLMCYHLSQGKIGRALQ